MKNEELKKIIGRAIEACTSHHMQGVKKHLIVAMREASIAEEKMDRNKSSKGDINKNWILDLASGSMKNMNKTEVGRALVNIEKMISDEENKNRESKPNKDIFMD
jgi:hypothetical protein